MGSSDRNRRPILLDLLLTYVKIGLFTFGGYIMISIIESYCAERKHRITHDEMMDMTVNAAIPAGAMLLYRHFGKKTLSPIMLIVIPAAPGIIVYSWCSGKDDNETLIKQVLL